MIIETFEPTSFDWASARMSTLWARMSQFSFSKLKKKFRKTIRTILPFQVAIVCKDYILSMMIKFYEPTSFDRINDVDSWARLETKLTSNAFWVRITIITYVHYELIWECIYVAFKFHHEFTFITHFFSAGLSSERFPSECFWNNVCSFAGTIVAQ